jgi:hypothetical protein
MGGACPSRAHTPTLADIIQQSNNYKQTCFHRLKAAPEGWPSDGKYFPLGPKTTAKGEWNVFWKQVAIMKLVLAARVSSVSSRGPKLTATEAAQDLLQNLRTHVLATVYCPSWAHSWASMLLDRVVSAAPDSWVLNLVAIKGGAASDEECAFVFVILEELGFTKMFSNEEYCNGHSLYGCWYIERPGNRRFYVVLKQYLLSDVDISVNLSEVFAREPDTEVPDARRVAVISCAEKWFINGKSMRINAAETDEAHPDGMTVNDKLNALVVAALKDNKERAETKGWPPTRADGTKLKTFRVKGQSEEERKQACEYFDVPFNEAESDEAHADMSIPKGDLPFALITTLLITGIAILLITGIVSLLITEYSTRACYRFDQLITDIVVLTVGRA